MELSAWMIMLLTAMFAIIAVLALLMPVFVFRIMREATKTRQLMKEALENLTNMDRNLYILAKTNTKSKESAK